MQVDNNLWVEERGRNEGERVETERKTKEGGMKERITKEGGMKQG